MHKKKVQQKLLDSVLDLAFFYLLSSMSESTFWFNVALLLPSPCLLFLVDKTKRRRDLQASPIRNVKTWHSQSATTTGTPLSQSPNVVSHTSSQQPGSVLTPPQPTMYPQKTDIVNYVVPEQLPRSGVPLMMHPQNGYQNKNVS